MEELQKPDGVKRIIRNFIQNTIAKTNTEDKFEVVATSCGIGKTVEACNGMIKAYKYKQEKSLFVVERNKEGYKNEKIINDEVKAKLAVFVESSNYEEYQTNLREIPILIITHRRYLDSIENSAMRNLLQKDRSILVIDEEIQYIKINRYKKNFFKEFAKLIPYELCDKYGKFIYPIMKYIDLEQQVIDFKNLSTNKSDRLYQELRMHLEKSIDKDYNKMNKKYLIAFKENNDLNDASMGEKSYILEKLAEINNILSTKCYKENDVLYNAKVCDLWKLPKTNVILDANARFYNIYSNQEKYRIMKSYDIKSYEDWTLYWYEQNTSKSKKEKYLDFTEKVFEQIYKKENDEILIITNKDECTELREIYKVRGNISIDYWGNLNGSNDYSEYNLVYVISTPNISEADYIMYYNHFRKEITNKTNLKVSKTNGTRKFANKDIEKFKVEYLTKVIYQGISRIGRNESEKQKEIHLFTIDSQVVDKLRNQMRNIKYEEMEPLEVESIKTEWGEKADKPKTRTAELATCFKELMEYEISQLSNSILDKKEISKKSIRERLKMERVSELTRLLKISEIVEYMKQEKISKNNNNIIISK